MTSRQTEYSAGGKDNNLFGEGGFRVERRPNPEHDRRVLRRVLLGLVLAFPSLALSMFEPWGQWAGVTGFLVGVAVVVSAPVNLCPCPVCRRELRRCPDATTFRCVPCGVTWVTRCYGRSCWSG
jgi:hypothetical protein